MTVKEVSELRNNVRKAGASFKVTKNRITRLALKGTKFESLADLFKGPTAIAFANDPISACKACVEFAKTNEKLVLVGGAMGTGVISLGIKTTTDNPSENVQAFENVKKSLDGFKKHIEMLKSQKVPENELSAAKLRYKTKILNAIESSDGQTNVLSNSQNTPYSISSTAQALKIIDTITPDDIYNAANYVFGGNSVISILASEETLKNAGV